LGEDRRRTEAEDLTGFRERVGELSPGVVHRVTQNAGATEGTRKKGPPRRKGHQGGLGNHRGEEPD
jgi:hypothetical protein